MGANGREGGEKPVIVVKKHGGHGGHHGGAWKVAYADFVTAMMAFFLVMWIVAQSKPVRDSVAGYFRDPVGFSEKARAGLLEGGTGILPGEKAPSSDVNEEQARNRLRDKAREILEGLARRPDFGDLAGQVEVEMTEEGLRIQMMESSKATFFTVGSASLSGSGTDALRMIGDAVAPLGYDVVIEGHTDSRPYASKDGYTNWELSSDRANAARRILEECGIEDRRIKAIRGYADKRLRFSDAPDDPRNRRITILVLNPYGAKEPAAQVADRTIESLGGVTSSARAAAAP